MTAVSRGAALLQKAFCRAAWAAQHVHPCSQHWVNAFSFVCMGINEAPLGEEVYDISY